MEVEQIKLAVDVRTGERDERVSRHVGLCHIEMGSSQGRGFEGLVGDSGKEFFRHRQVTKGRQPIVTISPVRVCVSSRSRRRPERS